MTTTTTATTTTVAATVTRTSKRTRATATMSTVTTATTTAGNLHTTLPKETLSSGVSLCPQFHEASHICKHSLSNIEAYRKPREVIM